jgi:glycosyltransferase involved in cell wall biosynthesis
MPVYNAEKYLQEAIDSIIAQSFRNFELIIIDDDSKDRTSSIIARYQKSDSRIQVYRQERQGLIKSLNIGCHLAKGKYIARMDADDISLPHRLEEQVKFMERNPNVGVLGSGVQLINDYGERSLILKLPEEHSFIKWCLCFYCPIAHPTVMMRKDVLQMIGGYSQDIIYAEDYDLWRRLSRVTYLSNLPIVLLYLRKHNANVSTVHIAEQKMASVKVSQLMISEILGENVDMELITRMWNKDNTSSKYALKMAELIYKLGRTFIKDNALSVSEEKNIRENAVLRILILCRARKYDARALKIFLIAYRLDPLRVTFKALKAIIPYKLLENCNP